MKNEAWPAFSFTEVLSPPEGWRTNCAILSTYSADLVVVVTALLALAGADLDSRRTGSRVDLVKAIEALRGRICVLAQAGRVAIPTTATPILKLLDRFVRTVDVDESFRSWHPKLALIRYENIEDDADRQWRVWIGSRNLTRALNWESGLVVTSRSDGKGQHIDGLPLVGEAIADRARLKGLRATDVRRDLAKLTWEGPPASTVHRVSLFGPSLSKGFPKPPDDTDHCFVVSPFLDARTVRTAAGWGGAKTRRILVSTAVEIQRLLREDATVFGGFDDLRIQPLPDLPVEGAISRDEEASPSAEIAESEEIQPLGLHAKLLFAAKGARRQLWLGSANATERGWQAGNFEAVAELSIGRDSADGIEAFVATCEGFNQNLPLPVIDADEDDLEAARRVLSSRWRLRQRFTDEKCLEVWGPEPPPLADPTIELEVATLTGAWSRWPPHVDRIPVPGVAFGDRSDFMQIRVARGDRLCAWVQIAPCDPRPDKSRDHRLIAQYLDPRTFLWWLRSLLVGDSTYATGADWDAETSKAASRSINDPREPDVDFMPTIEEILRAWARDASAFMSADQKVRTYLKELERRADESGVVADSAILTVFRRTWDALALELR